MEFKTSYSKCQKKIAEAISFVLMLFLLNCVINADVTARSTGDKSILMHIRYKTTSILTASECPVHHWKCIYNRGASNFEICSRHPETRNCTVSSQRIRPRNLHSIHIYIYTRRISWFCRGAPLSVCLSRRSSIVSVGVTIYECTLAERAKWKCSVRTPRASDSLSVSASRGSAEPSDLVPNTATDWLSVYPAVYHRWRCL